MSMYVRLKRKNQTIFLHVEPSNSFGQIKQRVAEVLSLPDPNRIQLLASDKKRELVDLATVSDQEVKNDDILYMVFAKEVGGGWEDLQVDQLASFGEEGSSLSSQPK
eukprot:gene11293-12598_t